MANELLILWLWCLFALSVGILLVSIAFLTRSFNRNVISKVKKFYRYMTIFFLALSFSGFLDLYAAYNIRYLTMDSDSLRPMNVTIYFYVITSILLLAFFILTRTIEKYITQSEKMISSKILLACFFISLIVFILPQNLTEISSLIVLGTLIPYALVILYWGVFYINLGRKSNGVIKKKAYAVAFGLGFVFIGISVSIVLRDIPLVINLTGYLFPIGFIVLGILGLPLLYYGFKKT